MAPRHWLGWKVCSSCLGKRNEDVYQLYDLFNILEGFEKRSRSSCGRKSLSRPKRALLSKSSQLLVTSSCRCENQFILWEMHQTGGTLTARIVQDAKIFSLNYESRLERDSNWGGKRGERSKWRTPDECFVKRALHWLEMMPRGRCLSPRSR